MSFTGNQVTSITVQDKEGNVKGVLDGKVILRGGDGIRLDPDGQEITLNAGSAYNAEASRYQRKYEAIINGGEFIDDDGTVMNFGGMPYYLASIGGSGGNYLGNFDFLSNACGQVGVVTLVDNDDVLSSESSQSESSRSLSDSISWSSQSDSSGAIPIGPFVRLLNDSDQLELLDICQACVDCEDYAQIVTLMERIEEFQDWDVSRNLDEGDGQVSLFKQIQAAAAYWNYKVHMKCLPAFGVGSGSGYACSVKTGYVNKGDGVYTCVQTLTGTVAWKDEVGALYTSAGTFRPEAAPADFDDPFNGPDPRSSFAATIKHGARAYGEGSLVAVTIHATEPMKSLTWVSEWQGTHHGQTMTKEGVIEFP